MVTTTTIPKAISLETENKRRNKKKREMKREMKNEQKQQQPISLFLSDLKDFTSIFIHCYRLATN
jgi:hypothetical protein